MADPFGATYDVAHLHTPQLFWAEVEDLLDPTARQVLQGSMAESDRVAVRKEDVEATLTGFMSLCDACYEKYLDQPYNQDYCISRLFESPAFHAHHTYAAEVVVKLTQSAKSLPRLLVGYEIILQYGAHESSIFKHLQGTARNLLPKLVHQVWAGHYAAQAEGLLGPRPSEDQAAPAGWGGADWAATDGKAAHSRTTSNISIASSSGSASSKMHVMQIRLREKAVRLMYEVCRVQKLEVGDMRAVDAKFVDHLFDLVEETRHNADEGFNYLLIKLIVALNEQFMVSGLSAGASGFTSSSRPTNVVMLILQRRLNDSKTFGENLIFMLNRASSSDAEDLCMQLLVLKLLYLLFTTKDTAHYFYTNDLKVLVDIFIRELNDLPEESESLRHTYLRVLHPLLTCTQLLTHPYKRPQVRRLLLGLLSHAHLRDITATTRRLVERCLNAEWCVELDNLEGPASPNGAGTTGSGIAIASVQSVLGGETKKQLVQTEIEEGKAVISSQATTSASIMIEVATAGEEASSIPAPDVQPLPSSLPDPTTGEKLALPKTRDKRVLSLSNPRPNGPGFYDASHARANTSSEHLGPTGRRTVSAAITRPASPASSRTDSPDLITSSIDSNEGASPSSMHSSWHAHMVEEAPLRGKGVPPPRPPKHRSTSQGNSTHASGRGSSNEGSTAALANAVAAAHPYLSCSTNSVHDGLPRLGSPLSYDITTSLSALRCDRASSSNTPSIHALDPRVTRSEVLRPPSLHVQEASNEEDTTPVGSSFSPTGCGTPGGLSAQRRRPPAPPNVVLSDLTASLRLRTDSMSSSGSASRASLDRPRSGMVSSSSEPNIHSPSSEHEESHAGSRPESPAHLGLRTSSAQSTARRRPPPPPGAAASGKSVPPPVNRATKGQRSGESRSGANTPLQGQQQAEFNGPDGVATRLDGLRVG